MHTMRRAFLVFTKLVSAQSDLRLHLFCACLSSTQPWREDACAVDYLKASHIVWYPNFKGVMWGDIEGCFLREPGV